MVRYIIIALLLLALFFMLAHGLLGQPHNTAVRFDGLICRTVEIDQPGSSCDTACAKVDMICTGAMAMQSPEQGCGDKTISPAAKCRCCAIAR